MKLELESNHLTDYLLETEQINFTHPLVEGKSNELYGSAKDELAYIKAVFHYIRDNIAHSWDIQSTRVTYKASDVLHYKEGICYAKSILLCALLRNKGVPAGFCYQRLTLGDTPDTGYALHALNAVYIRSMNQWIRLDARGNKEGVRSEFSISEEKLAFPIRTQYDEIDYPTIYVHPNKQTIDVLKQSDNCLEMYRDHLPAAIS